MKLLTLLNEDSNTKLYDKLFNNIGTGGVSYVIKDQPIDQHHKLSISFHRHNGVNHRLKEEDGYHKFKLRIIIRDNNKDDFGRNEKNVIRLYSNDLKKLYKLTQPIITLFNKSKNMGAIIKELNSILNIKVLVNEFEYSKTRW